MIGIVFWQMYCSKILSYFRCNFSRSKLENEKKETENVLRKSNYVISVSETKKIQVI